LKSGSGEIGGRFRFRRFGISVKRYLDRVTDNQEGFGITPIFFIKLRKIKKDKALSFQIQIAH
jgi:hypothetical protein